MERLWRLDIIPNRYVEPFSIMVNPAISGKQFHLLISERVGKKGAFILAYSGKIIPDILDSSLYQYVRPNSTVGLFFD